MADSLQKECYNLASKKANLQMENLSRLDEVNEDSRALRLGVDRMCEKILIIGGTLIKQNKFKRIAEERLHAVEGSLLKKVESSEFIKTIDQLESKMKSQVSAE